MGEILTDHGDGAIMIDHFRFLSMTKKNLTKMIKLDKYPLCDIYSSLFFCCRSRLWRWATNPPRLILPPPPIQLVVDFPELFQVSQATEGFVLATLTVHNIQVRADDWSVSDEDNFAITNGVLFFVGNEEGLYPVTVDVADKFSDLNSAYADLMAQAIISLVVIDAIQGSVVLTLNGGTTFRLPTAQITADEAKDYYIYYRGRYFHHSTVFYNADADQIEVQIDNFEIDNGSDDFAMVSKSIVDSTNESKKIAWLGEVYITYFDGINSILIPIANNPPPCNFSYFEFAFDTIQLPCTNPHGPSNAREWEKAGERIEEFTGQFVVAIISEEIGE